MTAVVQIAVLQRQELQHLRREVSLLRAALEARQRETPDEPPTREENVLRAFDQENAALQHAEHYTADGNHARAADWRLVADCFRSAKRWLNCQ